ncbi:hypothetical protein C1645_820654 [Glomus cerebriforme]|uniref:Uncharacterized protein n=1 Tax=Glomus cerebriforme TaxID=658196 RepID=A0A397T3V7_9GLOM|nr:hypothetical protein C1645_820654 [Glomus cerebriforme]
MIIPQLKTHISSRASYLSPADYKDIMQYRDISNPPSTNIIDKQNEVNFQNKYDSTITALKNMMHDTEVEPSQSTDPASEGDFTLGSKAKKTGGKKSKSKTTLVLPASSIETQPIPALKKDTNNLDAFYEKMVKKSTKIIDVKKKRYPENNLPIP